MTSVLFYNEIIGNHYPFENELLQWLKGNFSGINIFDVDNLTDSFIFDNIGTILKQSDVSLLILNCPYQNPVPNLMPLMEEIWKHLDKYYVLFWGNNPFVMKMIKLCKHVYINPSIDVAKDVITSLVEKV